MIKAYAHRQYQLDERDRLILEHVELARRVACRLARRLPPSIQLEEVIAAAMLGLAEAADRFDVMQGDDFEAFAVPRIRGAVLDELRRGDLLSRRQRIRARNISEVMTRLQIQLGRSAEEEEIAAALGVSLVQYHEELETLGHVGMFELDENALDVTQNGDNSLISPLSQVEKNEELTALRDALRRLSERETVTLSLYYNEELTYAEIARVFGVTESRICQIHSQAILRLRSRMERG